MNWKLIIIWYDRTQDSYYYPSREEAERIGEGYKQAFGNQVAWIGIVHEVRR